VQRILIVGAYSAIAEATARRYAARGAALYLVGRDLVRLQVVADDLRIRGAAQAHVHVLDVNNTADHVPMLDAAIAALGGIDLAMLAHGTLPRQEECEISVEAALREFSTNGTSTIALSLALAQRLRPGSTLAVVSSVAGDRGRASNYLYGSAKSAVTAFLSGLGQRLSAEGINVLTIKPGFVDTPMTRDFKKGALWATPDQVAGGIVRAIDKRKPVAYLPWFWLFIMTIIKSIPESVFRKIKI
jgi:decaprenylphospho-beta-D-erythro-pentofuranosid-2-ulose 2-reductase